jgi:hypothetical protein
MKTPIAFLIFNRPETTAEVFESIRRAKPAKLLIVADGPRTDRAGEAEKCALARAIIDRVDWNCEVLTNYSDVNLGCRERISSGLKWVFDTVEEAIILEDDCVPHPTFFPYCEELLDRYKDDERVMVISGQKSQIQYHRTQYSYSFSRYFHVWGWASWRRAFQNFDARLDLWPEIRDSDFLKDLLIDERTVKYWSDIFQGVFDGKINTWDYQWLFACWIRSGLMILPSVNLISNIGCTVEATHTVNTNHPNANDPTEAITLPLRHPPFVIRDTRLDRLIQNVGFTPDLFTRLQRKARNVLSNSFLASIFKAPTSTTKHYQENS